MKKTIIIVIAITAPLTKAADTPFKANISKDLLNKSKTIAGMNLKDDASYQEMSRQLFEGLTPQQAVLLQEALENDHPDPADAENPSAQTIEFVNNLDINNVPWLIEKADFWDIQYIYKAIIAKIISMIDQGSDINLLHGLKNTILADAMQKSDLIPTVSNLLQERIVLPSSSNFYISPPLANFNSNGSTILFTSSHNVFLYNINNHNLISIDLPDYVIPHYARYIAQDSLIAVESTDNLLFIYDNKTGKISQAIPLAEKRELLTYPPYSSYNYQLLVPRKNKIFVYDISTPNAIPTVITPPIDNINYAEYSPHGSEIMIGTNAGNSIFCYDALNHILLRTIEPDQDWIITSRPKYSFDDTKILYAEEKGPYLSKQYKILLYDTQEANSLPKEILQSKSAIKEIKFSPNNKQILILTENELLLYDVLHASTTSINLLEPYSKSFYRIQYTPDSSIIAIEGTDAIFVYDAKNAILLKKISYPPRMLSLQKYYTPNYAYIALATAKGEIFLYNITNNFSLKIINTHTSLRNIEFSPDNLHILLMTDTDFCLYPSLSNINFLNFDNTQLELLLNAFNKWKDGNSYIIKTEQEKEAYTFLNPILQNKKLFTITPEQIFTTIKQRLFAFLPELTLEAEASAFSPDQLHLLTKASEQWKDHHPYTITSNKEISVYFTLIPRLQDSRLFSLSNFFQKKLSKQVERMIEEQSSGRRIKDFFATVAHTFYRWLGKYDKPWPIEQRSKEAEKEEEE